MPSTGKPAGRGVRIALLPARVRDQIAAGEVIERPASAVKELVENAIDAGASRISIELEEGGTKLVRITDDGHGMPREDLELAFVAHATSKLFDVADLEHIASLGFRGEALASIGAVARCVLSSRERGQETGWRIEDEGGAVGAPIEAGGPVGTIVEVRELFYNVPARRRFLRRGTTELARCLDVIQRIALSRDGTGFVATHDGRRLYDVEPAMDLRARVRRTFGAELAESLVEVEARAGDLELSGFVAPPRLARSDASRQMWFLNGRPVRDKVLLRALKEGYRGRLFESRQPVAFLRLAMDPARVDVNVHPTKSEVRFRDERAMFGFLVEALRRAVARTDMATPAERLVDRAIARDSFLAPRENPIPFDRTYVVRETPQPAPPALGSVATAAPAASVAPTATGRLMQIARTYIVREIETGFEIVDQHALHERVTFEALLADLRASRMETQRLLVPELVEASPSEVELVAANAETLEKIGIDVSAFGPTTIAVNGLPARLARPRAPEIVKEAIAVLEDARMGDRDPKAERVLEEILHRAACRSSVMAGDTLSEEEMRALLERGATLESDQTCVHGRPTRVRFTLADLERAFLRR
ncbi:MAG TPA: DNA mismatch repair endonuclease MutL [Planctomycetota bacterium]|jgi:DNA mismatch repair protein MutL|nr:DNA mismatch repair endonuclease MutL [Planctomycetota bacterium]